MKPVALVTPWFGRDLKGEVEQQAWQIAVRLAARGHPIEVLTTCSQSHDDDGAANPLSAGVTRESEGFSIRRFPVQRLRAMGRVDACLRGLSSAALKIGVSPVSAADAAVFTDGMIKSTALLDYLAHSAEVYRAFLFTPYLYGTVLNGLPLVASKACLQPRLHNEAHAYLPQVAASFHQAKGILFNSQGEFELAVRLFGPAIIGKSVVVGEGGEVSEMAESLSPMDVAGGCHAREAAGWDKVLDRYEAALFAPDGSVVAPRVHIRSGCRGTVHQVVPSLFSGDAISNYVLWTRDELRKAGFDSHIFVGHASREVAGECQVFSPRCLHASDAILYHHCIGNELTPRILAHPRPKCLIYHNITPAEFYEPYHPLIAEVCQRGRQELRLLAPHFPVAAGVSAYNAAELREAGFASVSVLPLCINPSQWAMPLDPHVAAELQAGQTNLLFVGRLSPHKKQDDLIRLFRRYLDFDPNTTLHLVGKTDSDDLYWQHLRHIAKTLNVHDKINFAGGVTAAQLATYYRFAHLFWSMSEHEGFCVPLIEAMWHDVPVLACKSSAIPETLGEAGVMFTTKEDEDHLAALAWLIVHDSDLRRKVIAAQRRRRTCFLPSVVAPQLLGLVNNLIGSSGSTPQAIASPSVA